MNLYQVSKQASLNIFINKLRSFLALLGVLIGTSSIVVLITISEITYKESLKSFKDIGDNFVKVGIYSSSQASKPIEEKDLYGLYSHDTVESFAAHTRPNRVEINIGKPIYADFLGATKGIIDVLSLEMESGRFINYVDNNFPSIVIGNKLAQKLQNNLSVPVLGHTIQINDNFFNVIGILKEKDRNRYISFDINKTVFVSAGFMNNYSKSSLDNIILKLNDTPKAFDKLKIYLVNSLNQTSKKYFSFFYSNDVKKQLEKFNKLFGGFMFAIGSIALIVGGIGVMNVMLVSVSERKKEIGLRMAVGANQMDILKLFISESVILSFIGGFIGVAFGIFVSYFVAKYLLLVEFSLMLFPCLLGFSFSTLTGLFFGIYPAFRASKLNPINALRES